VEFQIKYQFMNESHSKGFSLAASDFDLDDLATQMIKDFRDGLIG
jgi:hypothetical protein